MMSSLTRALLLTFCLALFACESKGAVRAESYGLEEFPCAQSDDAFWASAPLPDLGGGVSEACAWVPLPGRTLLEIEHGLGRAPSDVTIYIAFGEDGASSTVASGDPGRIVGADETRVLVENTTEQDFHVRVVLR